jgi:3-phosphoshikimate 1-carboxyvinyltransferase
MTIDTDRCRRKAYLDHRSATNFLIMGLAAEHPVFIDHSAMIATSFAEFFDMMTRLGATIEVKDC